MDSVFRKERMGAAGQELKERGIVCFDVECRRERERESGSVQDTTLREMMVAMHWGGIWSPCAGGGGRLLSS